MSHDDLFIDPTGANRDAMGAMGRRFVDALVDTLGTAARRPPLDMSDPGPFPDALRLPEAPVPLDTILDDFRRLIVPGVMNAAHPGYLGHMDTMAGAVPTFSALLSAGLNNNPLFFEESPSITRLESELTEGFAGLFGLPGGSGGMLTTAGTLANLTAMLLARLRAAPAADEDGLSGEPPMTIFASELAHVSLEKAAITLGFGRRRLVKVPADARHRMDPTALAEAVAASRSRGERPVAVVATAGTTVVGSIDPLGAVADVARREGLWFHVDAAYGGTLVLSPTHRAKLAGIERADSITFNPQKWMYIPKACAMLLIRDLSSARKLLHAKAPYTLPALPGAVNLGDHAVQGTRHADALKLWMGIRAFGLSALGRLVDEQIALAGVFAERIRASGPLSMVNDPEMNIVGWGAFGAEGGDASDSVRNSLLQQLISRKGRVWVSCPEFRGRRILRTLFLNPYTTTAEVDALVEDALEAFGVGDA